MRKLQKAMNNPHEMEKMLKDPILQKQLEELKKRFGGR
jgi:hypothetical protein